MLKFLHRSSLKLGRILFLFGLALSFAVAVFLFSLRYWVLPDIEKYHDDVVRLATRAVGLQVKIGKIEADLRWFRPHLVFTNIELLDAQGNIALELRRVENTVSWMTLVRGELRLKALDVDDPELLVRRDKQGVVHVAGLQVSGQSSDGKLSDWLLHQSRIILNNGRVIWQDELNDRPALVFNQAQLRLDNSRKRHRIAVRVAPPAGMAAPLDIRGDLTGDSFSDWSDWHGELFAQINQADLGTWSTWISIPDEFSHPKGGHRASLGIENAKINRITSDLDMTEVRSRLAGDLPPLDLDSLRGRIGWHELEHGFEISTTKLSLQMSNGFRLQPTDFYLRLAGLKENPFTAGEMQANAIDLADLTMMAEYIPLGKSFRQKLIDFSPRGHIADLRAQWKGEGHFEVKARFDNMSMRRVGKLPGVDGLSGQINGSDNSGVLSLNAPQLKLDAPDFLLEPVTFDTFAVQTGWQRKPDGWNIKLNNFSFANEDLSATAYGTYQTDATSLGVADVNLNLMHVSLRHITRYLPKELLGKETMDWLQKCLVAGEADEAHLRLRGDLNDFPFQKNKNGIFQVEAKAKGVNIDYDKNWPRVENATGMLLIDGSRIQVDSTFASMSGSIAQKVSATIPDFMSSAPEGSISAEANVETKRALDFIKRSPLRGLTNGFADKTTALGMGKIDVQFNIPLTNMPIKVSGNYHFSDNEIDFAESIPLAKNVTGDLKFTESELQAKAISAQIYGGPATLSVQTGAGGAIKAKIQGRVNADVWHKVEPSSWFQSLNGTAEWNAEINVQNKQFDVLVTSNMLGMAANLPLPLFKRANEAIPLKFEFRSLSSSQDAMYTQYGDIVSVRLVRADDSMGVRSIKRGYMDFGPARRMVMVERDGVWITGSLPIFSLEGWSGLVPTGNGKEVAPPTIDGMELTVQKLVGYGNVINGVNIHARNHAGTITAQLGSRDLNGEVVWYPQGRGKIVARLKNAVLFEDEKDKKTEAIQVATVPLGVNFSIPVVDLAVEHFTYHGKQLGQMELHASQVEKDILLDHLHIANPDGVLTLNGKWSLSPAQTHVVAKLELFDTGKMLNRSGYPDTLKDGNGLLDGDLVWSGAPDEMKLSNLDGRLNLKMSKGQFLKVDPGAGKLLSVMNLQSLPKRIALDFNDVFSKGFEFDTIDGVAQLRQGVLMTNDFKISGSAAQITMSGQVDLKRETQNLRVKVMPTIGDSVSLLAFAAGPAVGAGVFLANKIFRDPLDKLVSFEYNVTGSWVDPKVEKVNQVKYTPQ